MEAVEAGGAASTGSASGPYDLALPFDMLLETPRIVAVQATGSSYTGGAHGNPLVARFVWLPDRKEMLRAETLVQGPEAWNDISAFVRESLHAALSQRLDADGLEPDDRLRLMRSGGRMIDAIKRFLAAGASMRKEFVDLGTGTHNQEQRHRSPDRTPG